MREGLREDFAMTVHGNFPPPRPSRPRKRGFATLRAVVALMLREMATSYGRSPGGYIWAVLEPVGGILLLTLVFSAGFRSPPIGLSFPIFFASGLLPFMMVLSIQSKVAAALTYSKPLLAYPTVTFVDSMIARFLLELVTKLLVSYLILSGCILFFETRVTPNLPIIATGYAVAALFGLALGTLNCFLFTRFPVCKKVWSIMTRPLLLLSGVIFIYEIVPEEFQRYLWYNPLIHITAYMRRGFYPAYDAPYVDLVYVNAISIVCLAAGFLLVRRYHRELLYNY